MHETPTSHQKSCYFGTRAQSQSTRWGEGQGDFNLSESHTNTYTNFQTQENFENICYQYIPLCNSVFSNLVLRHLKVLNFNFFSTGNYLLIQLNIGTTLQAKTYVSLQAPSVWKIMLQHCHRYNFYRHYSKQSLNYSMIVVWFLSMYRTADSFIRWALFQNSNFQIFSSSAA